MLREGEPRKSLSSPGHGASPARLVNMRTTTGAQTGKPRYEWQAGRTAQTPATETSPLRWTNTPLHAHEPMLGRKHTTPHVQSLPQPPGHPAGKREVPGAVGGDRGRWRARSKKRLRMRTCTQERAYTCMCQNPLAPSEHHAAHSPCHTAHAYNRIQNTMRHLPANMVKSKCKSGTVTTNPGDRSHGPQPGTESSHRPYRRRKYQTRRVLRYG